MKMVCFCEKAHFRFLYPTCQQKNQESEKQKPKLFTIFALTITTL